MDNAQKAIMVGVALFITIAVVSAVMLIAGIGRDTMDSSNRQLEGVADNVASQLLADYDAKEMTGASVIASIKKFYDKPNFLLAVDNAGSQYYSQSWYSTKCKSNSAKLTASTDGKNFTGSYSSFANYTCCIMENSAVISDNTPDITGLSSKVYTNSKYKSYIIYVQNTDTILGVYFRRIF